MEDRTPIKMVAVGATVVEKHDSTEFKVVHLLNPKILGEVPEDVFVHNTEPLEGRWKPKDQESQVEENLGAEPLEDSKDQYDDMIASVLGL